MDESTDSFSSLSANLDDSHVVLKVNVRLNILNENDEVIRQKEQSLVLRVPVEKLSNQATLDINLEDGVELANIDILEMDQSLELAEIDILKLEKGENLNEKISEALSQRKKTENIELINKLAHDLSLAEFNFQQEEELKREQEMRQIELLKKEVDEELKRELELSQESPAVEEDSFRQEPISQKEQDKPVLIHRRTFKKPSQLEVLKLEKILEGN
jgi:hypothetical protein